MQDTTTQVRIALPSKGRMEGETLDFLAEAGLHVAKTNPRQYSASIPALPGALVLFQRSADIPRSVAAGDMDLGITGYDNVAEALDGDLGDVVLIHEALGYGQCELVIAVPEAWAGVSDVASLGRRATAQGGLRVATKHASAVERFLSRRGVEHVRIVSADGALEAAPAVGYADFIADITSTGTTLHDNRLRPLEDGTVLRSQAVLIGNRAALQARPEALATARQMLEFVEAHLRARGQYLVFANMRGETKEAVARRVFEQTELGGLQGPTVSPLVTRSGEGGWWAINIVVAQSRLFSAIQQIRAVGGSGVVVTPATYIFEERPARYQRLLEAIGKAEGPG